jgi:streptogramin lyase
MRNPHVRLALPPTRLPFVNAEIATVTFEGEPHLVSSIWGGTSAGRIFFWSPETRSQGMRILPGGIPGAYMLKSGPDGKLYLGCGGGELVRYDPARDSFDVLVNDVMSGITWGGCVTQRHVVWTASPGHAAVYDWREERLLKTFSPLDSQQPPSLYGHRVVEAPDGKIIIGVNVPQAKLIALDPSSLEPKVQHVPSLVGYTSTYWSTFVDHQTLVLVATGSTTRHPSIQFLRYPELSLIDIFEEDLRSRLFFKLVVVAGNVYRHHPDEDALQRYDRGLRQWLTVCDNWSDGDPVTCGTWADRGICGVTSDGRTLWWDAKTGHRDSFELTSDGPASVHAACVMPELDLTIAAPFINQRFSTLQLSSGNGRDSGRAGPGSGQVNQILWETRTRRFLMSSYTTATITAYDPALPVQWPENPCVLASARDHEQMRPLALVHDGQHVWMGTGPEYGQLGGALSRIDPTTGEIRVWRHVVTDQTPHTLLVDPARRVLLGGTHIFADCHSAPPTRDTGVLFVFDLETLAVQHQQPIRPGVEYVAVRAFLPGGEVLVFADHNLWAWDPQADTVRLLRSDPPAQSVRAITNGDDGSVWATTDRAIGRLDYDGDELTFVPVVGEPGSHVHKRAGRLYYIRESELCIVDLTLSSDTVEVGGVGS